jgi:hypothetical protein
VKGRGMGRLRTAVVHITFTLLLLSGQIGRSAIAGTTSTYLKITSPANGATVHGTVTIGTTESISVSWINVFVDRVWVGSNSPTASRPYSVVWNSATVANGRHTVSVTGYDSSNLAIALASIGVNVGTANPSPTPSRRPTPTLTRKPAPTATAANWVTITAPAKGATTAGTITIATRESASVRWINVYVDYHWVASNPSTALPPYWVTWKSTTVANGSHTVSVSAYDSLKALIATTSSSISVLNRQSTPTPRSTPRPTPRATATPARTPTPTAACCPLTDAAAAARVVLNRAFEPRPDNYPANAVVPTSADLAQVGTLSFLNSHGNTLIGKVTGRFAGTTDEILQWASYKWGFDPNVTRTIALIESRWHQNDIGDVGHGVSLGILQIKSADYPGTCNPVRLNGGSTAYVNAPLCLSHLMTAFAADYKLAYQRACMDGSIGYLNQQTPTAGYPTYANATGAARLWGCIGDWFSGNWYDSGAISYIHEVQAYLSTKPWLQPGF